ncbi:hypothetical protein EPA93_24425 [Ktedonosporobacter rubrisoli]|uniref:Nuclear transport factor 2 family protein n=1 Tax=Ktedonosporobacter rubrisoli TaxID=2509675 RepID=A0A4P6JTQ4_KTERU|nr:hypothetical protein [Ktedonosporobacter rubrisoli]QBD78957.1 hypothetical protein EPA93_24425 [Ktedonosporobacter rubrisoli]
MVNIIVHEDCGNAPKKLFLKDFLVAAVRNDSDFITRNTTDDICWNLVGSRNISGKQEVLPELQRLRSAEVTELIITTIVTHGYHGAANGFLKFKDGKTIAFCDVYQFRASTNNAPIKAITTYAIELP